MSQVSVSLDEKHVKIVERHAKRIGITAFSTALQSIIIQHDQAQRAAEAASKAAEVPASEPVNAA